MQPARRATGLRRRGAGPERVAAQVADDRDPDRVELPRRRRGALPGHAVRLLDEGDAETDLAGGLGRDREVGRGHAARRPVAEDERAARLLHGSQVDAGDAVRGLHRRHRTTA
jgi:hypothetical protein